MIELQKDANDLGEQINVKQETFLALKTQREKAFGVKDAL